jgi:hypothetical protein
MTTITGGGLKISPEQAYWLLYFKPNIEVACKEYGEDNCAECEGECNCWTVMAHEDIEGMTQRDFLKSDWKNFEIW